MTTAYEAIAGNAHEATKGLTNRFAGEKITESKVVEAEGNTTLVTPAVSHRLTVYWVWLYSSQENTGEVLAEVKVGSKTPYTTYLGNPGVFSHWEPIEGAVADKLVLHLSGAQKVAVAFTYTESSES